jgi:hypothetical protein
MAFMVCYGDSITFLVVELRELKTANTQVSHWTQFWCQLLHLYALCTIFFDNAVSIATGYRLADRGVGVRVPVEASLHVVQTGSGVHPTSYPMGTGGSLSGSIAAGTRS